MERSECPHSSTALYFKNKNTQYCVVACYRTSLAAHAVHAARIMFWLKATSCRGCKGCKGL